VDVLITGPAAALWSLDPAVTFLNHGSFGACPRPVLTRQQRLREQLEREPVRFFTRELPALLDSARAALAAFVGADADDLAFVPNATAGVNAVLRSLQFRPGDELITTDHAYNACRNALEYVAGRASAAVRVARVPFPLESPDEVVAAVLDVVSPGTRLALLDHVTSPTGILFPVERLVRELDALGVDTLVDGAHAPGMLPLHLSALGAAYYTGACHKWMCAPKGAAFLHVRRDRQQLIRPLSISHGATADDRERSRFRLEFDWTGTDDPSAYLAVPEAIGVMGKALPGGWPELMRRNRALALEGRRTICDALGVAPPCPDAMIGSLATIPLPDRPARSSVTPRDLLQDVLFERFAIEVPIIGWPGPPRRLVRLSAQLYNAAGDYERLGRHLPEALEALSSEW
jgi:isopenicillin-N epimerase